MSKSNIVLAIIAGAAIGGIVAIILKAENALATDDDTETEEPKLARIAKQFSDKISSELKTAEQKIKSAAQSASSLNISKGEQGVYL